MKRYTGIVLRRGLILLKILLFGQLSLGQIVYHDIEPDIVMEEISRYQLDLNQDGVFDYHFIHDTNFGNWPVDWSQIACVDHYNVNELIGSLASHFHPYALLYNSHIYQDSKVWASHEPNLVLNVQLFYDGYLHKYGYWQLNNVDAFLGVRFKSQGEWLYGWIRLDVSRDATRIIIKDYAYNALPYEDIYAGEGIQMASVENVLISDVSDNVNASDILVEFERPENEFTILEYRFILVKADEAASFTLEDAMALPSENYTKEYPRNKNISTRLYSKSNDKDGKPIEADVEYKLFVLCMNKGSREEENTLSPSSNSLTLNAPVGIEESIDEEDIKVYSSSCDIFIDIDKPIINAGNVMVYNSTGKLVYKGTLDNQMKKVTLEREQPGIYFVTISFNNRIHHYKLLISE